MLVDRPILPADHISMVARASAQMRAGRLSVDFMKSIYQ